MMRKKALFAGLALAIAAGASLSAPAQEAWKTLGDKAPALSVDFVQGEPIKLEAGRGEHVFIVEFWATWCGPCRYTIPHLSELQAKYKDDGLVVIGISDEPPEIVEPYVEERGDEMTYRVAVDPLQVTARRYFHGFGGRVSIPRAFVVDGNGRVAWIGHPANPFMEELVRNLLDDLPRIREEHAGKAKEPETPKGDEAAGAARE